MSKIKNACPLIEKIYSEYAKNNHFPGYVFGLMVDGKLVYSGSTGYANIRENIPVTMRSMFRIASMTKSFTAMAILILRDEEKLRLDDAVRHYISELQNQKLTSISIETSNKRVF